MEDIVTPVLIGNGLLQCTGLGLQATPNGLLRVSSRLCGEDTEMSQATPAITQDIQAMLPVLRHQRIGLPVITHSPPGRRLRTSL